MDSTVQVISCSKRKGKKPYFRWRAFMMNCISTYKSQRAYMELDFEADKPRIKN